MRPCARPWPISIVPAAGGPTANRLLGRYLDDVVLTPTELLHHYRELKRLLDMDLTPAAVDRVATVQAAATQSDSRERRDRLQALLDQALK